MCTFKQAIKFLFGRIAGVHYGILFQNGEQKIVKSEYLNKLNVLLTEDYGQGCKLSATQVNKVFEKTHALNRRIKSAAVFDTAPFKYYNYPYRKGALIFNDDSKLVFGITPRAKLPSFYNCLAMI